MCVDSRLFLGGWLEGGREVGGELFVGSRLCWVDWVDGGKGVGELCVDSRLCWVDWL
jgi:hypothetical protein